MDPEENAMRLVPTVLALLALASVAACTAKAPEAKPAPTPAGGLANGSFTAELPLAVDRELLSPFARDR